MPGGAPIAPGVREAGEDERQAIAAMLARAFADDPVMSYIFPDRADRIKRLPRLMALLFSDDGRNGPRFVTGGGEAATLWRSPGRAKTPVIDMARQAWPLLHALGGSLLRGLNVSNAIEAHFPKGDFWYLHIAGCDPSAQRRGFGGAAVRAGLEHIAGSGVPAYLETATEQNLPFYRALGFAVTAEWTVPRGGPRFWSLQRG